MKLKALGLAAVAAMALTAFTAGSASATTLEVGGVKQNKAVTLEGSLKAGTSTLWMRTDGSFANTCSGSTVKGSTVTPFTGTTLTGPSSSLSFPICDRPATAHKAGTLHVESIAGTTDGTVSSSGTEVTVGSIFGTLNCKTSSGVDIGTLTGTDGTPSTHAEMDINAVLDCGFLVPSASWKGTYVVTSPTGLGVVA
ncbi:MAG TPA: hypothetical protein VIT89_10080 [Solirubrobacterales bacterium]